MADKKLTLDDILSAIDSLPYNDFRKVVKRYADATASDFESDMERISVIDFEKRLNKLGVNNCCPKCGSVAFNKVGKRNHIQVYRCKDCGSKLTAFTGTILEKTKWHWDIWIKVLEMTINSYSVQDMVTVLEQDYGCVGINYKTVWLWRMKLLHAIANLPMPELTGVIQIDETFIREAQKGSRELVSTVNKTDIRTPRYGRRPSTLGVMGPEFATIVSAVDNRGYCVCKVSSLGRLSIELFVDLFEDHLIAPAFLCTDANKVYEQYCNLKNIPHYERPSNYQETIEKNGYETPNKANPAEATATETKNRKVLERLYNAGIIDRITNRGYIPYEEFEKIKKQNALSLGRVNELHSDIKRFIYSDMKNVSTKYLQDYIGFFTYIRNWSIAHGRYPASRKDTEEIFLEILKSKVNYTTADVKAQELDLPKPSSRYIKLLEEETRKARAATANRYFKFNEEDGVISFNKREYLLDLPKTKLYAIAKECKLTRYKQIAVWSLVSKLLEQPNISDIIYRLLLEDRHIKIDEEDLQTMKENHFKIAV